MPKDNFYNFITHFVQDVYDLNHGFIVDALFGNCAYLQNLYTVIELHTNFVLIHFESQSFLIFFYNFLTCETPITVCLQIDELSFCYFADCRQFLFE